MLFDPITNTYTDLKDGQLLAKMEQKEQVSNFEDLYVVELEREKTLVIKKITNEAWSEETKKRGTFWGTFPNTMQECRNPSGNVINRKNTKFWFDLDSQNFF